eukprot:m.28616 g.28616  ORF g.28616 m.28616 type:complete len:454 (-) comp8882_c0_seq1:92-1453(-)
MGGKPSSRKNSKSTDTDTHTHTAPADASPASVDHRSSPTAAAATAAVASGQDSQPSMEKASSITLRALVQAMGGNNALEYPPVKAGWTIPDDDLRNFECLLDQYLTEGGDINARASFKELFGIALGIADWTLFMAAGSLWVNSPECMGLLRERGADPLLTNSSGRGVLAEALAAARFQEAGPLNWLHEHRVFAEEEFQRARQTEATEMLLKHSRIVRRRGGSVATRHALTSFLADGLPGRGPTCAAEFLRTCFEPMQLVPFDHLLAHGALPRSSDNLHIPHTAVPNTAQVVFVSHRWLQNTHPDDSDGTKFKQVVSAVKAWHAGGHSESPLDQVFVWLDFACIDQDDAERRVRGMNSLPFCLLCSDAFVQIGHQDLALRAWCRLERAFALSLRDDPGFTWKVWLDGDGSDGGGCLRQPHSAENKDPRTGLLAQEADRHHVSALSWFAEQLLCY